MEGTDGDADEAEDFDTKRVEHAANVAIFAFVESDFEPGVFFAGAEKGGAFAAEDFVAFCFDATFERFEKWRIRESCDSNVVGFIEMRGGIGDPGVPLGVVGEEEEAFAGFVEAADGCEPGQICRQERVDGVAAFFVRRGSDDAAGLVHHEVDFFGGLDGLSLHFDAIGAEADGSFRVFWCGAVEADFALADQFDRLLAGTVAEFREGSSQANFAGGIRFRRRFAGGAVCHGF